MKKLFRNQVRNILLLLVIVIMISCKKDNAGLNSCLAEPDPNGFPVSRAEDPPSGTASYPFVFEANGPFTISPVSPTIVKIDQQMSITLASPFDLTGGTVHGFDDLTIPTFPDRFFNGSFSFFGRGNDSLFARVTVQTSVFSDPVNPADGDFFGSEDFTGTFQITGGSGRYLNAKGQGEYSAHSEWRPPINTGTFFSGTTVVNARGSITVVARSGQLQSAIH